MSVHRICRDQMRRLRREGHTATAIAELFGVSVRTTKRITAGCRRQWATWEHPSRKLTDDQAETVLAMRYAQRRSVRSIAMHFGVDRAVVYKIVRLETYRDVSNRRKESV